MVSKAGPGLRHYVVVSASAGKPGGRYASKSGPDAAARKAASKRFGRRTKLRLTVRETGTERTFTYDATRVKLAKPIVRTVRGVTIKTAYRVDVKAVKATKAASPRLGGGRGGPQLPTIREGYAEETYTFKKDPTEKSNFHVRFNHEHGHYIEVFDSGVDIYVKSGVVDGDYSGVGMSVDLEYTESRRSLRSLKAAEEIELIIKVDNFYANTKEKWLRFALTKSYAEIVAKNDRDILSKPRQKLKFSRELDYATKPGNSTTLPRLVAPPPGPPQRPQQPPGRPPPGRPIGARLSRLLAPSASVVGKSGDPKVSFPLIGPIMKPLSGSPQQPTSTTNANVSGAFMPSPPSEPPPNTQYVRKSTQGFRVEKTDKRRFENVPKGEVGPAPSSKAKAELAQTNTYFIDDDITALGEHYYENKSLYSRFGHLQIVTSEDFDKNNDRKRFDLTVSVSVNGSDSIMSLNLLIGGLKNLRKLSTIILQDKGIKNDIRIADLLFINSDGKVVNFTDHIGANVQDISIESFLPHKGVIADYDSKRDRAQPVTDIGTYSYVNRKHIFLSGEVEVTSKGYFKQLFNKLTFELKIFLASGGIISLSFDVNGKRSIGNISRIRVEYTGDITRASTLRVTNVFFMKGGEKVYFYDDDTGRIIFDSQVYVPPKSAYKSITARDMNPEPTRDRK